MSYQRVIPPPSFLPICQESYPFSPSLVWHPLPLNCIFVIGFSACSHLSILKPAKQQITPHSVSPLTPSHPAATVLSLLPFLMDGLYLHFLLPYLLLILTHSQPVPSFI